MNLVDSHCHLDDPRIDVDAARRALTDHGVSLCVIAGYGPERLEQQAHLCRIDKRCKRAVGLHPWWLAEHGGATEQQWRALAQAARGRDVVAVGELGLDKGVRERADLPSQRQWMRRGLRIARESGLPAILHVVGWHGHALAEIDATGLPRGGVVHRFSGSDEVAAAYVSRGIMLSLDVIAMRRDPHRLRRRAKAIPLTSLVLETDWPERDRSYNASLAELATMYRTLAADRDLSAEDFARQVEANNRRLYGMDTTG